MPQEQNARIVSTHLGYEDHGILTFFLTLEIAGGTGVNLGGYALDDWDADIEARVADGDAMGIIGKILGVVGVSFWEQLTGQYIRVRRSDNPNRTIQTIGNLMQDKWLNISDYFSEVHKKHEDEKTKSIDSEQAGENEDS